MKIEIEKLPCLPDMLGESPIWDDAQDALYWVDGHGRRIRRHVPDTGQFRDWAMPSAIGSIGLADPGKMVAALADGFYLIDLAGGAAAPINCPLAADAPVRFNDGKVDRQGRFLAGTLVTRGHDAAGKLYRLNLDHSIDCLERDVRIANSLCFSPDGAVMYFADTMAKRIYAYDYGDTVGNKRLLVDTADLASGTDGAAVDADGCLWVALVQIGKLGRFTPAGRLDRLVDVPVDMPSCPAFGGLGLDTLYVTSIRDSGTGRAVSSHADGGHVFVIRNLGVCGLPEPRYAG